MRLSNPNPVAEAVAVEVDAVSAVDERDASLNGVVTPVETSAGTARLTRIRYWILVSSHAITDIYPAFIFSLMVALEARLDLTKAQTAFVIAINPIVSGLAQPFFSWFADRFNTRIFGPLGLAMGALCLGLIGHARTFDQLIALQVIGIAGIGVYHPIASAVAGRLSHERGKLMEGNLRRARGQGLSIFFAAGMIGGVLGPRVATFVNEASWLGLERLDLLILPGVLFAVVLWLAIRRTPHKDESVPQTISSSADRVPELGRKRFTIGVLFFVNSCRFLVNIGVIYLFGRWAETIHPQSVQQATTLHGYILSASAVGMGVSALVVGRYVHAGQERGAMILVSLLTAPLIFLMPFAGPISMALLGFLIAFGYFGLVPASISLAHRLLPGATSATASLLLGCGWAVSASAPFIGEALIERFGLFEAFAVFGILLALAGVLSFFLPADLIKSTADD